MKDFRFGYIVLIFFMLCGESIAQSGKGYLLIAVKPDDAIIRLDTTFMIQKRAHQPVDTGTYVIKAWAPGRMLVVDTLKIGEGKGVLFRRKLQHTEEYKRYKTQKHVYNMTRYLPGVATIGIALYYTGQYFRQNANIEKYLDKANESKAIYENLTDAAQIEKYQNIYNINRDKYDSAIRRTNGVISNATIVIPSAIVVTGVLYYVSRKVIKPVFNETPLLSDLSLNYELTGFASGPRINTVIKF